jgi:cell division protein ZapA (FtsZ GTPase activity inhibitor)
MGNHTVTILQKNYNISCSEAEVPHLQECTDFVNNILKQLMKNCKTNSENTIMAMGLLMITDELLECKKNAHNNVSASITLHNSEIKSVDYIIPEDILLKLESLCQTLEKQI